MSFFIQAAGLIPCLPELQFKEPISLSINKNEHWAFVGPNGAGKTLLADIICGKAALKHGKISYDFPDGGKRKFSEAIQRIAFRDVYGLADYKNMYYQQRFNSTGNDEVPCVDDLLDQNDSDFLNEMLCIFDLKHLSGKKITFLSSGELRKFLIIRVLQKHPNLLVLDNPFIGLDALSRDCLNEALNRMAVMSGLQIILLLSSPNDIPEMITHVLPISGKELGPVLLKDNFLQDNLLREKLFPSSNEDMDELPGYEENSTILYENVVEMKNIRVRYGQRTVLENINWTIAKGEKWALSGPNGAGKSTLLSLIYADNPQSYSNNIVLFDRKRGSGESIWDIKRRIGYVSPEIHLFYLKNVPAADVVGSGFFDTIGLYRKCNAE